MLCKCVTSTKLRKEEEMKVLVLNAGSSSLKFTLFNMENGENTVLASGQAERLGLDNPKVINKRPDGYKSEEIPAITNHAEALQVICKKLLTCEISPAEN